MLQLKRFVGLFTLVSLTSTFWQTQAYADTLESHRLPIVLKTAERALRNQDPNRAMDLLKGRIDGMRHEVARAQAHALMCKAHYQASDYVSAERSCDLAVTTGHPNWSHFNNRGVMRFMLKRYEEALNDFSRAASLALLPATNSQSRKISKNVYAAQRRIASK